jgi:Fe-S-cluster containining protein
MPPAVRDTLDAYYTAVRADILADRERRAEPCLWYDPVTRRCLHYDWRPSACREFVPGSDDCMAIREYSGR